MSGKPAAARHIFRYSDAVQVNYEVHGHGGTPIVLLHGFAAALITCLPRLRLLSAWYARQSRLR